jgi:5-methyltetrahydropteroyltriglutamate--homocysteine methyltransferase
VVPAEQVCVSTDCAIASVRRVVAKKKLQAWAEGTRIIRDELTGAR